jgi:hypothetical protein
MHRAASGNKLHNWFTGAMQRRTQKKNPFEPFSRPEPIGTIVANTEGGRRCVAGACSLLLDDQQSPAP